MASVNLPGFRLKVREYRLLVNRNQSELAAYLNLDYNELSNRLNAHKKAPLSHNNVRGIVRALADWGAISTRAQAEELLDLMLCPHFDLGDWQAKPLSKLTLTLSPATYTVNEAGANLPSSASSTYPSSTPPTLNLSPKINLTHNLPQQLSSFIGRHKEVAELKERLGARKGRLVTLVGAGGCGKTRLSLKVAEGLLNHFRDGVWFIELAPLNDSALIPQTIAMILGLSEHPGRSILASLNNHLRSHQLLLVLDNCEHLIGECARVVDTLLSTSTELQILASSREALGIRGETIFHVPSLTLPDSPNMPEVASLPQYEAVSLFQERAVAVSPSFAITDQNAPALVKICRQLDGIPLALELAAARIKVLTVEQIADRLDDRFRLLTDGSRSVLARQKTLQALIDWSYELLSPAEKRLLSHLSVFVSGWTLAAAEAVGISSPDNEKGVGEYEVLDALSGLVNKSLVQVDEYKASEVEARYHFLETIRQYGLEKLKAGGEERAVRDRYLAYYLKFGGELAAKINGREQLKVFNLLDKELANVRSALEYSLEIEQLEIVVEFADRLFVYWDARGYFSELRRYLEQALVLPTATGRARGTALFLAGFLAARLGDFQSSRSYYNELLTLSKQDINNKEVAIQAFAGQGLMHLNQGNYGKARHYLIASLALVEETNDAKRAFKVAGQHMLGWVSAELGEYEEARRLYETSLATAREMGHLWSLTFVLRSQAELALIFEEYEQAQQYLEESLRISEEISFPLGKSATLTVLGIAFYNQGKFKEARQVLEESLVLGLQGGGTGSPANVWAGVAGLLSKACLQEKRPGILVQLACLCGAISAWTASRKVILYLPARTNYEQSLEVARSGLDEAAFGQAFANGQTLTVEETTALCRQALSGI